MPHESLSGGVSAPKPDNFSLVEESMLATLKSLKRQQTFIEESLARLRAQRNGSVWMPEAESVEIPVRKDEYRGLKATEAMEVYLKARRGQRIPLTTIVKDLIAGGVHPGLPRRKVSDPEHLILWNLKIALTSPISRFRFEPQDVSKAGAPRIPSGVGYDQVSVWLSEKADTPKKRVFWKSRKSRKS